MDNPHSASFAPRPLEAGKEGVEEAVVVVGKPKADVAAVHLMAELLERVLAVFHDGFQGVLLGQVGLDIYLSLRIEHLGEGWKVQFLFPNLHPLLRKEQAHRGQQSDDRGKKDKYLVCFHCCWTKVMPLLLRLTDMRWLLLLRTDLYGWYRSEKPKP